MSVFATPVLRPVNQPTVKQTEAQQEVLSTSANSTMDWHRLYLGVAG